MKYFGSKSEYHTARSRDLLRAYFCYLKACSRVSMPEVFRCVVDMPASRFWVSVARASVVMANIERGDKLHYMRHNKREMFFEIHRRITLLRQSHPNWSTPRLLKVVLEQPAPKFYLAPGSARVLILKARKQFFAHAATRLKYLSDKAK